MPQIFLLRLPEEPLIFELNRARQVIPLLVVVNHCSNVLNNSKHNSLAANKFNAQKHTQECTCHKTSIRTYNFIIFLNQGFFMHLNSKKPKIDVNSLKMTRMQDP